MSKARIFRQIIESAKPPESGLDLWLEPNGTSFWLNAFKRERQEWVSLGTKAYWGDIINMPDYIKTDEAFKTYVNKLIENAGIADSVAFKYDGTVEQITALAKTLSREVDGEEVTLPSVDAALERIIAKVWFQKMVASLSGMSDNVYIGEAVSDKTLQYSVTNFSGGEDSYIRVSGNDSLMSLTPSGDLEAESGSITLAGFTPTSRKSYKVTLEVSCEDSDGVAGGQKQSPSCSLNAYWPVWAWKSEDAATEAPSTLTGKKMLMSTTFTFSFENGNYYYYLLLPVELSNATQANTGDWKDKFSVVNDSAYTICNRKYKLYRTTEKQNNTSAAASVTVTVKAID